MICLIWLGIMRWHKKIDPLDGDDIVFMAFCELMFELAIIWRAVS